MKIKHYRLGQKAIDRASGIEGLLNHAYVNPEFGVTYSLIPRGENPETGGPLPLMWVHSSRVEANGTDETEIPNVMLEKVKDMGSGIEGVVVGITIHPDGCLHVDIQPPGKLKSGKACDTFDVCIRRIEGKNLKKLTEAERKEEQAKRPSPSEMPAGRPR